MSNVALIVDDFASTHAHMLDAGTAFEKGAHHAPFGAVAESKDLYSNRWGLIARVAHSGERP